MINETERRESLLAFEVARESKSTVGLSQCQLLGAVHCRRYLCFPESQQTPLYPHASRRFPPLFSSGVFSCYTSRWRNYTKTSRNIICSTIISWTSPSSFGESNWFYLIDSKIFRTVSHQQAKSFCSYTMCWKSEEQPFYSLSGNRPQIEILYCTGIL